MSKKNRLDEGTIRRFMGLSGIGALGENFIDRLREEDDIPPEEDLGAEEVPVDDAAVVGDEVPVDDAAGPPAEADVEVATEMATDVADAVASALSDVLGQHGVEVTAGEAEPDAEVPVDDLGAEAPPEDLGAEPELGAEVPPEEEEVPVDDLEEAGIELVDDENLVQEVARRVAARLMKGKSPARARTRRSR